MRHLRIKQRRKELGLTQRNIADALGVSKASVSLWEKGDTSPKNIHILAKSLKCDPDWLQSGTGNITSQASTAPTTLVLKGSYPVLDWVQAGNWSPINEISHFDAEHYPCPIKCSAGTFLLKVRGQSMAPQFNEGELIFIDPAVEADNGKYVVARLDDENEATLKQLIVEGGKRYLKATNPDWPNKILAINGNCTIVGVVIFAGRLY